MCVRVLHNVCTCESVHKNRVYVLFTSPVTCIPLRLLVFPSGDVQLLFFCFFRRRDDGRSGHRSGTIDYGCFKLVERYRYVTGGMEFDLTPLHSTTDVSFIRNAPMPSKMLHSSSKNSWMKFYKLSRSDNQVIVDTTRCCAPHLCWWCITRPSDTMGAPTPVLWTIPRPWRPSVVIFWSLREHFQEKI